MENFFLGVLEITVGMSLLILLMLVILKLIGGKFTAKCRYILWTLVLVRLAVPFSFGILPALIEVPIESESEPVQIQMQIPTGEYTPVPQNPVTVQPQEQIQTPAPPMETPVFTEPEPEPLTWEDIAACIPYLYLAGAAAFLAWNLLSYLIYIGKILRSAREADPDTQAIYKAVCRKKKLNHPPDLLVSAAVNSPAAFGIFRRRIVLPDIAFTENGLAGTLSHEVTHCKRGDLYIKAIALLARSLHWFNPLVHLAAFRCEMEMELSCDEAVLAGCGDEIRAAYGEVMLDIIRRCRRNRGTLTTHFNPRKNAVKARFTNILYGSGKKRGLWLIAVCLVLCVLAGAIVACRTEAEPDEEHHHEQEIEPDEENHHEQETEPLPDGETVEILLIYTPYTEEISQDMFVEEISETEISEILQDEEFCGVRVILYLDENELFCAAYEKDDTLFRFIRTGGVKPVVYDAAEFSDILEADGFAVSWSWAHKFRAYFTVEDSAPKLYLYAYDSVAEADYDNDGVTEVICQNMTNVDIYDISDGTLQTVSFDSELIKPKPGEFYRYLPEKNWFEFDYKKDGDDTLYHRYGMVKDGILTLVTPVEITAAEDSSAEPMQNVSYLDTVMYVPARWYTDQIGLLGTAGGDNLSEGDFMFWLDEWRAYEVSETGRVWTLEAVPLDEFAETAEFWKNTDDTDIYTQIFSQASCLLGTDTEYAYVLTLPTDVQFLENDPVSRENYGLLQAESQTVLENFMNQNGITPNLTCPASEVYAPQGTGTVSADAESIYQTFLDTTVAPYMDYISSLEYNDLDGNGIPELLLYDKAMGICEIYTIEGGEVKAMYNGTSLLTVYSDTSDVLAPPSLGATDEVFYASPKPDSVTDKSCKNWFVPCTVSGGFMLYSTYGHVQSRTSQYFYFYSGEDSAIGKFLCVMELGCFKTEAIGSSLEMGWECWYQGEKVTKKQYLARLEECWDILEQYYGVTYGEENTLHFLDELRKAPDTSSELLADLLDTLKTDDPQAYISRTPYGETDSAALYPAWGFGNDSNLADDPAENYTFEPLDGMEVQETPKITLHSVTEGEWTIHSWVQSNYIELITGGKSYFFRAAYKYNSEQYFGSALKEWFDHAEYAAAPYLAVIPDEGQGFLAAAQTFADSWFSRQLQVSSGSRFAFSSVSCTVWDADNRETLLENGRIGENTYTYYVRVIFVGENPHSIMYHDAGNTELYTGNDPAVPKNAYESTLCGYITLEEDGWHGEIGGTGW